MGVTLSRSAPFAAAVAPPALAVEGATKIYGAGSGAIVAVEGMSFDVAPGEFV